MMLQSSPLLLLLLPLLLQLAVHVRADCECECGTIAENVCAQDACDFICAAAGDYGSDCGNGTVTNCEVKDCISSHLPVFSCTQQGWITAGQVQVGEQVQTSDGGCSDVYYTHHHHASMKKDNNKEDNNKDTTIYSPAMEIVMENEEQDSTLVVSKNHLVYKKMDEKNNDNDDNKNEPKIQAVMAKTIQAGDELLAAPSKNDNNKRFQKVAFVQETTVPTSTLVNVLTVQGSVALGQEGGGVVISSYSYEETMYAAVFYPLRILYHIVGKDWMAYGTAALESPTLQSFVQSVEGAVKPMLAFVASNSS